MTSTGPDQHVEAADDAAPPPSVVAPTNDWRRVSELPAGPVPHVSVVVPVFERVELLDRTLAGLVAQTVGTDAFDVVVVDDGSSEDVAGVVARHAEQLDVRLERRERSGFGAGAARDRGVELVAGPVVLFLDADCIPVPRLVERHAGWHARARNVAVVGTRRAVDSSTMSPAAIAAGTTDLYGAVGVDAEQRLVAPDDWRAMFQRLTRRGVLGDAAFRTMTTANLSVRRALLERVGGFDPAFRLWGGEDTELAWRLWNDGVVVVPEDGALALHQTQLDGDTDRAAARRSTLPLVADRVPHAFYRTRPSHLALVPTVSWLACVDTAEQLARVQRLVAESEPRDSELVLLGPTSVVGHLVAAGESNPRLTVVVDDAPDAPATAVHATRGEVVLLVAGGVRVPLSLPARAVERLRAAPASDAFRASYTVGDDRWLRLDDLADVDAELGAHGLPLFAAARRRSLMMHLDATPDGRDVAAAWAGCTATAGRVELSIRDAVRLQERPRTAARLLGAGDVPSVDAGEVARTAVRAARALRARVTGASAPPATDAPSGRVSQPDSAPALDASHRIGVEYVGLTGKQNLGDDAVQLAIERLMPWADVGVGVSDPRLLVVGGGTLLNGKRYYLTRMQRADSPVLERALFGTGVRSPAYWGVTEPMEEWFSFLDSTLHASVRGPDSVDNLRELGYEGTVEVIGDPAFSLRPPSDAERVEGRVVVSPVWTEGNLHGGDDAAVFRALADTVRRLRGEGREVVMLSCFPQDDRYLIQLMRDAGAADMPYVAGYDSVDDSLRLLASADLVIGERLHAAILAASAGRPFVALEYRPKVRDFGRSVGQQDAVLRTDEMQRLDEVVDTVLAELDVRAAGIGEHVERYRGLQQAAADGLHDAVRAADDTRQ